MESVSLSSKCASLLTSLCTFSDIPASCIDCSTFNNDVLMLFFNHRSLKNLTLSQWKCNICTFPPNAMGSSSSTGCPHPALDLWLNLTESLCLHVGWQTSANLFCYVYFCPEVDSVSAVNNWRCLLHLSLQWVNQLLQNRANLWIFLKMPSYLIIYLLSSFGLNHSSQWKHSS